MIIVKLNGGLGNQMFQYALGKHLANKHRTKLKLDVSEYATHDLRRYELHRFKIKDEIISEEELNKYLYPNLLKRCFDILTNKYFAYKIVTEKKFSFIPDTLNTRSKAYLIGYWQTEKYFKPIEFLIRECFLPAIINETSRHLINQIENSNSVSIHIRRGDYVSNEHTNKIHGVCDMEYYDLAIEIVSRKIETPVFYIFSDDINWVKHNLNIKFQHHFVSNSMLQNDEEMNLMSLCKHNIIANSSFSWWGAWLNKFPHKIIIAPKRWYADEKKNAETKDLIPDAWIRI